MITQIKKETDLWKKMGKTPRFWIRDDDLKIGDPLFYRINELSVLLKIPIKIAVIPIIIGEIDMKPIGKNVIWMHGIQHKNKAPQGLRNEFPEHISPSSILPELKDKKDLLISIYGPSWEPVFVPPWNNISRIHFNTIFESGFSIVSTISDILLDREFNHKLRWLDVDYDVMDWRNRALKHHSELDYDISRIFKKLRGSNDFRPIGILTHVSQMNSKCFSELTKFMLSLESILK